MKLSALISVAFIAGALFASPVVAQMNLNSFYSRDVKQAYGVATRVDSVTTSSTINSGIATTIVTMVVTPVPYDPQYYNAAAMPAILDSIEVTLRFWLPTDFVATNMWLWVNGERQTAYIQDRALAAAQYNQIVGTRKDPALLEFWGNGSYNFRMFPAQLNVSRKVAIEFQHTFDDDAAGLITAHVPLAFDSTIYWYGSGGLPKSVGFVKCTFVSIDQKTYTVDVPGLGNGTVSAGHPLTLQESNVMVLGSATIATTNRLSLSDEYFWTGRDKDARFVTGCATILAESTVVLEPEPDTRIIVLDVRERLWNREEYNNQYNSQKYPTVDLWLRAQKFAVLCLQNYVKQGQRFNVVLAGAQTSSVFSAPVVWSAENLQRAYQAIISAKPDKAASTLDAVTLAAKQAGTGITILISDLYQPYDYYIGRYDSLNRQYYNASPSAAQFDSVTARIGRAVTASDGVFFTITDCWEISSLASNKGGYNLASLHWDYYYNYYYSSDYAGKSTLSLPKLFSGNGYAQGITDLSVTGNLDSITFATDGYLGYYYGGWRGGLMVDMAIKRLSSAPSVAKTNAVWRPYYNARGAAIKIAGIVPRHRSNPKIDLTVSGRMGGLRFTKKLSGSLSSYSQLFAVNNDIQSADNVQWAFIRSEQLGMSDWNSNASAIKQIGLNYHIVTRQTSLLALEPGMQLWPDTNAQNQRSGNLVMAASESRFFTRNAADGGTVPANNLDSASLEDIIAMNVAVKKAIVAAAGRILVQMNGSIARIALPLQSSREMLSITLYDLGGKVVYSTKVDQGLIAGNEYRCDLSTIRHRPAAGTYLLKVSLGAQVQMVRVALAR